MISSDALSIFTEIDKELRPFINMVWDIPKSAWGRGNVLFWVLSTWFGANLLVQAYWIGIYGNPLDANMLFQAFGPIAWVIAALEILLWTFLLVYAFRRTIIRIITQHEHQTDSRAADFV